MDGSGGQDAEHGIAICRGDGKLGQLAVRVDAPQDAHAHSPDHCAAALNMPKVSSTYS